EREARETFPAELLRTWGKRDPIGLYEEYLKEEGRTARELETVEADVTTAVEQAAEQAVASREQLPGGESARFGVYARNGREEGEMERLMLVMWVVTGCSPRAPTGGRGGGGGGGADSIPIAGPVLYVPAGFTDNFFA